MNFIKARVKCKNFAPKPVITPATGLTKTRFNQLTY